MATTNPTLSKLSSANNIHHVVMIAPTPYFSDRGCHIRIWHETKLLEQAGIKVTIFTYHLGRNISPGIIQRALSLPWYTKTTAGPAWQKPLLDLALFLKAAWQLRGQRFDLIHAHLHEGAWIGIWLKWLYHKPVILDAQDSMTVELRHYRFIPSWLEGLSWKLEDWIVRRVDYVLTSSTTLWQWFKQRYGEQLTGEPLPDGILANDFPLTTTPKPVTPLVIYTGSLLPTKGIDALIEAIPHVITAAPQTRFMLIGYPNVSYCEERLRAAGVLEHVQLLGQQPYEQLMSFLQQATIAVEPKPSTSTEASGKLLNYMMAGLACVTFAGKYQHATLADSGVIVPTETAEALSAAIIELIQQPAHQQALGESARQRALTQFNFQDQLTTLQHAYATVVEQRA